MKNFLVIYYAPAAAALAFANLTPEQKAKGAEPWMAWKSQNENNVVNLGAPLMIGQSLQGDQKWDLSKKEVSGFSILQGESIETIKTTLNGHPHLVDATGSTLEIYEYVSM